MFSAKIQLDDIVQKLKEEEVIRDHMEMLLVANTEPENFLDNATKLLSAATSIKILNELLLWKCLGSVADSEILKAHEVET